jgi:hypothetical protein
MTNTPAHEVHTCDMHIYEVYIYEMHACDVHTYEVHVHDVHAVRCTPMRCR